MWAPGAIEVLNTALVSAEREAAEILARRSAEDDLMMERDALVGKIDTLERLAEDRLRWPLLWLEIAEAIPPDASLMGLEEISMSPAFRLRLHGVALHHEAIRAFIEQLERLASIREVRLIQTEASVIAEGGVTGAHHFELEVLG
jgi:Tfp pilus assembly protein PilN